MYVVTGVSRGLGKAIVTQLLEAGETVAGIGRSHAIDHPNFQFHLLDLSDLDAVEKFTIEIPQEPIVLINNAGILGEIKRLSDVGASNLEQVLKVNTIAPTLLTTMIYNQLVNKDNFTLVNISSGAANRSIPSWGAYCASKAAINMLSENFKIEEEEKGNHPKVYAVAPGVIDTDMQDQIRRSGEENFSSVENFIAMKENDQLFSPDEAAKRLLRLLRADYADDLFYDLRNV